MEILSDTSHFNIYYETTCVVSLVAPENNKGDLLCIHLFFNELNEISIGNRVFALNIISPKLQIHVEII